MNSGVINNSLLVSSFYKYIVLSRTGAILGEHKTLKGAQKRKLYYTDNHKINDRVNNTTTYMYIECDIYEFTGGGWFVVG